MPRRVSNLTLSFEEFIRAHSQGCFVCYGQSSPFRHDHRTCPIHKADGEAHKKADRTKKRTSVIIREDKVGVSKDELSKLMIVGTKLAKDIQEIKRAWVPKADKDKNKDKDKKGKSRGKKERDAINGVAAEEDTLTTDAP